jgi:threonylcarbamoyladenosine tRNA methylthiotransferase MtaB
MKIYLDTIGCRLNQSEIEFFSLQFRAAGYELVGSMEDADIMVLNSCAVTAAAASDSRQKIRQANRAGVQQIAVTGCLASLKPDDLTQIEGVTHVIPNSNKNSLVSDILQIDQGSIDLDKIFREPIPGSRYRTRAFIKVQDGCDNQCTYCITTIARGPGRSQSIDTILRDIDFALKGGAQEIVLTGVHLGSWGYDLAPNQHLKDLIKLVLKNKDIPRLRISSLEPWDIDPSFFDLWEDERLCRHLHLPLQSGSASVLRRMARKITPDEYSVLVNTAREKIPDLAITTDLMAGFPGETEEEFKESFRFIEQMNFSGGHVFTYSEREGTPAVKLPGSVHNFTRKERSKALRDLIKLSEDKFKKMFIGKTLPVLWEHSKRLENDNWVLFGLSDNYLKIRTESPVSYVNRITKVKIKTLDDSVLSAKIMGLQ